MSFEIGSVIKRRRKDDPIRVLACDEVEILYDVWRSHLEEWRFKSLGRSASYYRMQTQSLLDAAEFLRVEPMSKEELAVHRPDLPLRLLRST